VAERGVRAGGTNPGTTSPASLEELTDYSGPPPSWRQSRRLFPQGRSTRTCLWTPWQAWLLLGPRSALDRPWTEARPGTEGAGLIRPSTVRHPGLSIPGIAAKDELGKGDTTPGQDVGDLPEAPADVDEASLSVPKDLEEGAHVLGGVTCDGIIEARYEGRLPSSDEKASSPHLTSARPSFSSGAPHP
jgi:hypothetical protein